MTADKPKLCKQGTRNRKKKGTTCLNIYCCHVLFCNAIALRSLLPSTVELHFSERWLFGSALPFG